jgi:hypothetical protein
MDGGFDSGGGVSVYSEAKGEYTKQLLLFITPAFHRFFMNCLAQAATEEPQVKRQLWKFQELLSQIPDWNLDKVHREVSKLVSEIQCDYLEELVTAVFIAHTKVLTAIRIGNKNKRVQITIPKLEHFLHRSLSECSRLLWTSAYLFHNELSAIEKQKNHRQIEQLIHEGISQAIRGLLPVKNILKDYLTEAEDADDEDKDEDEDEKEDKEKDEKEAKHTAAVIDENQPAQAVLTAQDTVIDAVEALGETSAQQAHQEVQQEQQQNDTDNRIIDDSPAVILKEPAAEVTDLAQDSTPAPPPTHMAAVAEPAVAVAQQPSQPNPVVPTLIVDTEPSVRFTNFDQVIQEHGNGTSIGYVEKNRDAEDDTDNIEFLDDDGESLSDFEDLTQGVSEPLDMEDFETL